MFSLYRLVRNSFAVMFKLFYHHKIYGQHFIMDGEGGIIAPNHTSHFDPPAISASCPQDVHFLARKTLFEIPIIGRAIARLNSHPTTRGGADLETIRIICKLIEESKKVVIFPEGTRSVDGRLGTARLGVGMIALKTKCKVYPVYIHGTYEIMSRESWFPKLWGRTACVFGSPFSAEEFSSLDRKEGQQAISNKAMARLAELKQWYESGAHGEPP